MSDIVIILAIIGLMLYFEFELVKTALTPIIDIMVSIFFIITLVAVIVAELVLIVVAPVALVLGRESRQWHIRVARKLMLGGKRNADHS